ncbi:MAG: translocation/assembly module TamB domain-containing protein [Magnetococcales bacterium]|nr:translocation/assembly module TamB domain-containing protein [Magnetococcales bacterium]
MEPEHTAPDQPATKPPVEKSARGVVAIFFKTVLWFLGILVTLPVCVLLLMQFESVQNRMLFAMEEGGTVRIHGLSGQFPFDMRMKKLQIQDEAGTWLEIEQGVATLSWRGLLHGKIHLPTLVAEQIKILRLPQETTSAASMPVEPFNLLALLPRITLEQLQVTHLELGKEILGEKGQFQLSGKLGPHQDGVLSMDMTLTRTDRLGTELSLKAGLDASTRLVKIAAFLQDQSGFLSTLLGESQHENVALSLTGEGPIDHWQGELDLSWPTLGRVKAGLILDFVHPFTGSLQGVLHHPVFAANPLSFSAGVHLNPETLRLDVTALRLETTPLTLTGSITTDFSTQSLNGALQTEIKDLAPFSALTGTPLSGAMTGNIELSGLLTAPRLLLNLKSDEIKQARNRAQGVTLTMEAALPQGATGLFLKSTGSATSVLLGEAPRDLPLLHPQWSLIARFPDAETLILEQMTIQNGEDLSVTAQGSLQLATLAGRFTIKTQLPQLDAFSQKWPWPIQGTMDMQVDAMGVDIVKMEIDGTNIRLRGKAGMNWQHQTLYSDTILDIPNLTPLALISGKKVAGSLQLKTHISGPFSSPQAKINGSLKGLTVDKLAFQNVTLAATATDLMQKPTGSLELVVMQPQGRLSLDSRYQFMAPDLLALNDLKLQGPKTELLGALKADLKKSRITGKLKGKINDLAALEGWHGQHLAGRVEMDVALETASDGTNLGHVLAKGANLSGEFGRVETLQMDAKADLRQGQPNLDASLKVMQWHQGALRVEALKGRATGTLNQFDFSADGHGVAKWPFVLRVNGQVEPKDRRMQMVLQGLEGTLGKEAIKLKKPVSMAMADSLLQIEPWEIAFGEAKLQGHMTRRDKKVDGSLVARGDLAILQRLGIYPIRGASGLNISLQGREERPDVVMTATLKKGKPLAPGLKHLPPLDLTLTGSMQEGSDLKVDFQAHGVTHKDLQGHVELPLRFGFHPLVLNLSRSSALVGTMQADIKLADLAKWLEWEERQRMEGVLVMDLKGSGTLDHPQLNGSVTLEHGRFEQADAGTSLHDIKMVIHGTGDLVTLETLSATDGEKGRIDGDGQVRLDAEKRFPWLMNLRLSEAVMVRRDDALASLSGEIRLDGDLGNVSVKGGLTINRSEIYLPDMGGKEIAVVELDEARPEASSEGSISQTPLRTVLDLVINVPSRSFVRGRGLDSEWMGKVQVAGVLPEPQVTGQLKIRRGELDVLNRRFLLNTGVIDFDGTWPPIPTIELEASIQRSEMLTHIGLQGLATRPKVTLTSEPVHSEEEILSQLLFDRTTDSITPTQALKLAVALKSMQGGGPGFMGSVQRELGIDRLEVGGDSVESGTVSAGKYLTDGIYLEVEKGLKADSGRINVEVEMTPRLFLKTGVDAKSNGDIGVQWKKDY